MKYLLYIEASPRKKRSSSIEVANTFLEAYRHLHPEDQVDTIDLWHKELSAFDGDVIDSKYAITHGQAHTEAQRRAWRAVEELIDDFKKADKYVISLPMWNFGIPYRLKHYIDLLVQPSYTFSYSPSEGYKGLVVGKPLLIIYSRGGAYGLGTGSEGVDFQKNYLETVMKFIGFTDIRSIVIEPTLATPELKEKTVKQAKELAATLAAQF